MAKTLTLMALARVLVASRAELAACEETLNSLNVYPVPDGDTGTNMRTTLEAGLTALEGLEPSARTERVAVRHVLSAVTRAAQGNSGVILSEYLRGFVTALSHSAAPGAQEVDLNGDQLARALNAAASSARSAVERPVEGTMLSVADAAAQAAASARSEAVHTGRSPDVEAVALAASDAAGAALARSPQQLDVLAESGVVDAGGAGLAILLECLSRVAQGRHGLPRASDRSWLPRAHVSPMRARGACGLTSGGPAFEVMGVVEGLTDGEVVDLRDALAALGDSVVVAGGDRVHRLHVHTDEPLTAISRAREAARLTNLSVTRFDGALDTLRECIVVARDEAVRRYAESLGATVREKWPSSLGKCRVVLADHATPGDGVQTRTLVSLLHRLDEVAAGFESGEDVEVLQAGTWRAARDLVRTHLEGAEVVTAVVSPDADAPAVGQFCEYLVRKADRAGAQIDVLRLDSGFLVQLGVIRA